MTCHLMVTPMHIEWGMNVEVDAIVRAEARRCQAQEDYLVEQVSALQPTVQDAQSLARYVLDYSIYNDFHGMWGW